MILAALACACGSHEPSSVTASADAANRRSVIEQLIPARDAVGATPSRFAWTRVAGADAYAIGMWNEVDMLVWRADNVPTPSIEWPADHPLEPGTYFWSVTAVRSGRPIAESGRAAFVVR